MLKSINRARQPGATPTTIDPAHAWVDFAAPAWSGVYYTGLVLFTLLGLGFILFFPVATLLLLKQIISALFNPQQGLPWLSLLLQTVLALAFAAMSYALAITRPALPGGQALSAEDAPALLKLVDELRGRFKTPRFDQILLTPDYSVQVIRTPRSGFPLFFRYTLTIGLPLLQTQTPLQVKVQLARRIGQLCATPRLNRVLLSLHDAWQAYAQTPLTGPAPAVYLLHTVFRTYAPLYHPLCQRCAREDELFADDQSMQVVHHEDVAQSMLVTQITQRFLDARFWAVLFKSAIRHPAPLQLPFAGMEQAVRKGLSTALAQRYLNQARLEKTPARADMPSLSERMENIGHTQFELPPTLTQSAAEHFLGAGLQKLQRKMDKIWLEANLSEWQRRHRFAQRELHRLKTLLNQIPRGVLKSQNVWECAMLVQKYVEDKAHVARLFKILMKRKESDARTHFYIGRFLLSLHDPVGVQALERAMSLDSTNTVPACQLITRFMVSKGERKDAQAYRRRALEYQAHAA